MSLVSMVIAAGLLAQTSQDPFYSDGTNYVYREAQSCALYIDYPDNAMLRISYRRYSREVFLSFVGGPFEQASVGESYQVMLSFGADAQDRHVFPTLGMIQPGDDARHGLAAQRGEELLPLFRRADRFQVAIGNWQIGQYGLTNMQTAIDKLQACSMAYFAVAPRG